MNSKPITCVFILTVSMLVLPNLIGQGASHPDARLYLYLEGTTLGRIRGEVTTAGREESHSLLAYSHEITSPYDPASGLATGRRRHQPFRVVKLINRGSPLLMQALATNERLTTVWIDMWVPSATGKEVKLFTYELGNARLVSIRPWMPNKSDAATAGYPPAEELAFAYESITITYHDGGITATDTWADSGS